MLDHPNLSPTPVSEVDETGHQKLYSACLISYQCGLVYVKRIAGTPRT